MNDSDLLYLSKKIKKDPLLVQFNQRKKGNARAIFLKLVNLDHKGGRRACKPFLSKKNIQDRLRLATEWYYKEKIYFKVLYGVINLKYYFLNQIEQFFCLRKDGLWYNMKNLKPTIKIDDGSIMIWEYFFK